MLVLAVGGDDDIAIGGRDTGRLLEGVAMMEDAVKELHLGRIVETRRKLSKGVIGVDE